RFKPENIILVGLMPGPKEPKTDEINSYLEPLVDDLKQLYVGMRIPTHEFPNGVSVRAALLMVTCDIQATRKTSGFTVHNSTCACYRCSWHGAESRLHAEEGKDGSTLSERHQLEVENGVRWLQLQRLGYFDLVCGTIIDPMHNLFLG
ncbi:hypothetical protein PHYBLDRAFT_102373, partial [Phycomyces blakesleeanus NRRL 1555(-)]